MKAITPIIAIIVLLLITVAMAGAGYSYINMYVGGLTNNVVEVTSATCSNGQVRILLRNSGTGTVDTGNLLVLDGGTGNDLTSVVTWSSNLANSGKVLELRFDDPADPLNDTSGNGNNGTAYDGAHWVAVGKYGGAFEFDGVDDYVNLGTGINLQDTYTVAMWFNANNRGRLFASNTGTDMNFGFNGNGLWGGAYRSRSGEWPAFDVFGTTAVPYSSWHHGAFVVSGIDLYIYLDGAINSSPATAREVNITNSNSVSVLGQTGMSWARAWFNGTIDEVRVYTRALSAAEIAELAADSITVQPGGMVSFTHACAESRCSYNIVSGGRVQTAYAQC